VPIQEANISPINRFKRSMQVELSSIKRSLKYISRWECQSARFVMWLRMQ
jgi:hypothetical protein